ncbi:peptide chain release factor 1-like, mitochondrial isoform X1 [Daktulosphaira vitifoliae]|uniref:peptide chain release factor 1-like, mitochondrial isoform X1 n=1 Tax=Daktulosphaira vitifoliae TaxID=58002 RepID=UPI0021A9FD28|nr:peptide chain release factor 1-like, mitochondrial isoform X1 [Daktulosphaira vitifoliae]
MKFINTMRLLHICKLSLIRLNYSKHNFIIHCFSTTSYQFSRNLLDNPGIRSYIDNLISNEYSDSMTKPKVSTLVSKIRSLKDDLLSLQELDLDKGQDSDFYTQVNKERDTIFFKLNKLELELLGALVPKDESLNCSDVILEITAGVGGQEAMIFTQDLLEMYSSFTHYKGWQSEMADYCPTDLGGIRHVCLMISGNECYRLLRHEGGVHRVQRVPKTEKSGRIHTSTVTVAILPQPTEFDVIINDKDLIIETKRASGAGGQHVNKTDSAVRMHHKPSGIIVECQTDRSQIKNRKIALQKLRAKLYQMQLEEQISSTKLARKLQVGSSARSEKIRTYNFNQDRITDHRLSKSIHNLVGFLEGTEILDKIINELETMSNETLLYNFIQSISLDN